MIRATNFIQRAYKSNQGIRIARNYNDRVVEYFENPPNVGSLKRKRKDVGTGNFSYFRANLS